MTMGGESVDFLLDTEAIYSVLTEATGPLSPWFASIMGLSGWAKHYYFSRPLSCNQDSVLFFTWVSDCARFSLTPFGEGYTEQGPCLCFQEYGALPFSPINWTKCKSYSMGWWKIYGSSTKCFPVVAKLKDPHLFPHKKQYPLKPEVKEGLKPINENLKEHGLLFPCNSPCNIPILGIENQVINGD